MGSSDWVESFKSLRRIASYKSQFQMCWFQVFHFVVQKSLVVCYASLRAKRVPRRNHPARHCSAKCAGICESLREGMKILRPKQINHSQIENKGLDTQTWMACRWFSLNPTDLTDSFRYHPLVVFNPMAFSYGVKFQVFPGASIGKLLRASETVFHPGCHL